MFWPPNLYPRKHTFPGLVGALQSSRGGEGWNRRIGIVINWPWLLSWNFIAHSLGSASFPSFSLSSSFFPFHCFLASLLPSFCSFHPSFHCFLASFLLLLSCLPLMSSFHFFRSSIYVEWGILPACPLYLFFCFLLFSHFFSLTFVNWGSSTL